MDDTTALKRDDLHALCPSRCVQPAAHGYASDGRAWITLTCEPPGVVITEVGPHCTVAIVVGTTAASVHRAPSEWYAVQTELPLVVTAQDRSRGWDCPHLCEPKPIPNA